MPVSEWVSEWGLTSLSTHYRSFQRRVFPVSQLQPNKNNQETEHSNNTTQKGAIVNSTTDTLKKYRLRERTDRACFSRLLWHPARKQSGSVLTTPEPARGYSARQTGICTGWGIIKLFYIYIYTYKCSHCVESFKCMHVFVFILLVCCFLTFLSCQNF